MKLIKSMISFEQSLKIKSIARSIAYTPNTKLIIANEAINQKNNIHT